MKLYDENQYIQKNLAVNHIVLVNWWTEKQNMWEKYNKNGIIYRLFCEHELFQLDYLGKNHVVITSVFRKINLWNHPTPIFTPTDVARRY